MFNLEKSRLENIEYLINELNSGRNLKILFISHNAFWSELEKLKKRYKNYSVDVAGETGFFAWKHELNDYDIIYYNSSHGFDKKALKKLELIASSISKTSNKRVSILYTYRFKKNNEISDKMKIISFKDLNKDEHTSEFNRYYTSPRELTGLVLKLSDELDNQKIKINKKN